MLLACLAVFTISGNAMNHLTYSRPAEKWMEALPLGNGRMGAMVFGGTDMETISLSEITMWSGAPDEDANNLCGKENLARMRQAFFSGDVAAGNRLGEELLSGHSRSFGTNLPFGNINVAFSHCGKVSNYERRLSLENAIASVGYTCGAEYRSEYFCSNPSQVLVARFSASEEHGMNARIAVDMLRHGTIAVRENQIEITGDARKENDEEPGVTFFAIVRVITDEGCVETTDSEIIVKDTNSVMLIADIRTNFQCTDYVELCKSEVAGAATMTYEQLKNEHVQDFRKLFNRMDICLGKAQGGKSSFEEQLGQVRGGHASPTFDTLFFQYGRYMLISASRENSPLPAHLQGVWNDNLACNMAWTCDYHLDINIQQNYWAANITNLAECNTPLFAYLALLADYGSVTAAKMYGCGGWVAHTINNIWGSTAPGSGIGWAMNVTAGAWLATHLWTHYDFTRDTRWLSSIGYPLLKSTAQFFVDYMVEDPNTGYLVTGPSISPETSFVADNGKCYSLSMMPTIDRAVVHDIYKSCIESCKILGKDNEFRSRLESDITRLPDYGIHPEGDIKEWLLDVRRPDMSHRHSSHLLGLYPFGEISPRRTPVLAAACKKFLSMQTENQVWEDNEWSRGCMMNYYARLGDANRAYASLQCLYSGFMGDNLMTVSPAGVAGAEDDIFSFDATEAAVSGMCEMILQSYDGYLDFLPCLPAEWADGSIRGICARGGITADITWHNGKVVCASLCSTADQTVMCKINGEEIDVALKKGKMKKII